MVFCHSIYYLFVERESLLEGFEMIVEQCGVWQKRWRLEEEGLVDVKRLKC